MAKPLAAMTISLPEYVRKRLPPHVLSPLASVKHINLSEVKFHKFAGSLAPDLVLSPLISPGFDALDLLAALRDRRFAGRFLMLAPAVPDIPLIRAEMLAQAGGVDLDVISLGASSTLHEV